LPRTFRVSIEAIRVSTAVRELFRKHFVKTCVAIHEQQNPELRAKVTDLELKRFFEVG